MSAKNWSLYISKVRAGHRGTDISWSYFETKEAALREAELHLKNAGVLINLTFNGRIVLQLNSSFDTIIFEN